MQSLRPRRDTAQKQSISGIGLFLSNYHSASGPTSPFTECVAQDGQYPQNESQVFGQEASLQE